MRLETALRWFKEKTKKHCVNEDGSEKSWKEKERRKGDEEKELSVKDSRVYPK